MQPWNQWGVQANSYSMPGYPSPIQSALAQAGNVGAAASTVPQYSVPYQWPNYTQPGPASAGVNAWQQQQQQWDQWQQWQQQYQQWQQQYGKEYMAAVQAGQTTGVPAPPPEQPKTPSTTAPPQVGSNKRPPADVEASADNKKQKTDDTASAIQSVKSTLEEMAEAEKQFDEQFNNWESQFNSWREENANHPDTEQYKAYESKWTSWRTQLLQRREQMKKKRDAKLAELEKLQAQQTQHPASTAGTAASTTVTSSTSTVPSLPSATVHPSGANPYQPGLYGNMSFPMGFNQQGYMFGQGGQMFPPVPPPVMPPSALLTGDSAAIGMNMSSMPPTSVPPPTQHESSASLSDPQQAKSLLGDATKLSSGSKTNDGGIPGLDLINSGNDGNVSNYNLPPMSLTKTGQETIQTPADSKPFDFPPPGKMPQGMMNQNKPPQMNMPPPSFRNQGNPNKMFHMGANLNQPPPMTQNSGSDHGHMGQFDKLDTEGLPNLIGRNIQKPGSGNMPQGQDYNFHNPPPNSYMNKEGKQGLNFNQGNNYNQRGNQTQGGFNPDNKYSQGNNFSPNIPGGNNFNNQGGGNNFPPGGNNYNSNNYGSGNFSQGNNQFGMGPKYNQMNKGGNFGNSQGRPDWGGPMQKPALLPTPLSNPLNFNSNQRNDQSGNFPGNDRLSSPMRGSTSFGNDEPGYNKYQNFQDKPQNQNVQGLKPLFPQDGHNFPPSNSNLGPNSLTPGKDFRYLPSSSDRERDDSLKKADMPTHIPAVIYDYYNQPANLGVPEIYEPCSMIDYAHAPSTLPDEHNFDEKEHWRHDRLEEYGRPGNWARVSRHDERPWDDKKGRDDYRTRDRDDFRREESRRRDDRGRDDRRDDRGRALDRGRVDRGDDKGRRDDRRRLDRTPEDKFRVDRRDRGSERDRRIHKRSRSRSMDRSQDPHVKVPEPPTLSLETSHPPLSHSQLNVLIDDLISEPGRNSRPPRIVIIIRGPPGSGKSFLAKLIKGREVQMGGSAPRILSLDDYFMVEIEKIETDSDGRKSAKKVMEYEYEAAMEPQYRESMVKSFKKTLNDGYFPFVIVDAVNNKLHHFEEISSFAKQKGFQVYICETELDLQSCLKRNVHKRSESEIEEIIKGWEKTPAIETLLDIRSLLQDASIMEVDMEDTEEVSQDNKNGEAEGAQGGTKDQDEPQDSDQLDKDIENEESDVPKQRLLATTLQSITSKWDDLDSSNYKLDRLDGLSKNRRPTATIKDWLQLPEDYFEDSQQASQVPGGKKRVRWADLEERREQEKMRAIGFVVGQTDWTRMMDPNSGQHKLAQTKYI
ncbi:YLP motif-containing protein 1 isoform X2 [Cimex lectularius]|uniref:YLP motif-containing protein 1 n=1 Tax=Cimex lectularius TaxID=79782 RepID=A0A8I6S9M9_CIMLE|nr:YLP motif-containing protein 1 isoform X2 [Cimex lectularius]